MSIPDWYILILLALASYRTWRLLAEDEILERPREWLIGGRKRLAEFVVCPWCLGFWVALGWWGAWQIWEFGTEVVAVPLALSALVPLIERVTSPDET